MCVCVCVCVCVENVLIFAHSVDECEQVPQERQRRWSWDAHPLEDLERLIAPPVRARLDHEMQPSQ